ncbi:uncharacterized protein BXZ73DRAFT_82961 [Epithele typhae]|uniref:uncharacterized protein n=1 Tax=Epithele typhae TaxID=378194 RepID=UPI0020074619|nr:uncharacterized protein BXZ73DRAFT_82961 [Epithele typhae]KAH9911151.1 hypothetical protein BXZ73DRAFT_82961 [Epithele typhae]
MPNTIDNIQPAVYILLEDDIPPSSLADPNSHAESRPAWATVLVNSVTSTVTLMLPCTTLTPATVSPMRAEAWFHQVRGPAKERCELPDDECGLLLQLVLVFRAFVQNHEDVAHIPFDHFAEAFVQHARSLDMHEPAREILISLSMFMVDIMPQVVSPLQMDTESEITDALRSYADTLWSYADALSRAALSRAPSDEVDIAEADSCGVLSISRAHDDDVLMDMRNDVFFTSVGVGVVRAHGITVRTRWALAYTRATAAMVPPSPDTTEHTAGIFWAGVGQDSADGFAHTVIGTYGHNSDGEPCRPGILTGPIRSLTELDPLGL